MTEREFQGELIKDLKKMFEGCIVVKNDPNYIQGFPDLTIFYKDKAAVLECKASAKSGFRPNQLYYINHICKMGGFARVIHPENKEEVLNELQQAFSN